MCVDNFGIKCQGEENAKHLLIALKQHYEISEDWDGSLYCGISLKWNHQQHYIDTSMTSYYEKHLKKYNHIKPTKPVDTPLQPLPRKFGSTAQEPAPPEQSPLLNEKGQQII